MVLKRAGMTMGTEMATRNIGRGSAEDDELP
jgi:hypothetical protein